MAQKRISRLTRPLRMWQLRQQFDLREYNPKNLILIGGDVSPDRPFGGWEAAIGMNSEPWEYLSTAQLQQEPQLDPADFVQMLLGQRPKKYIHIGDNQPNGLILALELLEIPWILVPKNNDEIDFQRIDDVNQNHRWSRELIGRRMCVYAHIGSRRSLKTIIQAFRLAKRNVPELALVTTGVDREMVEQTGDGLQIADAIAPKSKTDTADVIVDAAMKLEPHWAACANVALVVGSKSIMEEELIAALNSGAALVLYGFEMDQFPKLQNLHRAGLVWRVRRQESLASALDQALLPERASSAVLHSIDRLTSEDAQYSDRIDEFLAAEAAT